MLNTFSYTFSVIGMSSLEKILCKSFAYLKIRLFGFAFFFFKHLKIFIWLHWILVATLRIFATLDVSVWCMDSLVVACRPKSARAQQLHCMWDLNSLTRGQACVSSIARQILNQWTTREVPSSAFELMSVCTLKILTPYQIYGLQTFSLFCRLLFHFVD